MRVTETDPIRQQLLGQFRIPEDGNRPYTHVNGEKLTSKEDQKKSVVYVNNESVALLENGLKSSSPKLFDSAVGIKETKEPLNDFKKDEKPELKYDKTGKKQTEKSKEESRIDQWV